MIDFGALIPIVAILASAWVMVTLLHYKHGGARRVAGTNPFCLDARTAEEPRENARLQYENDRLKATVERLEERIAVLERIATDPAERTAREIESLR
jgi:hypothetical protein